MSTRTPVFLAAFLMIVSTGAQVPGDRFVQNRRATRSVVMARNGMIATSQPLASAAGLRVLQDGGNAVDAAVTAAAVLAVVEPTMNGIGGDLFALVYDAKDRKLRALNASGRSSYTATAAAFRKRGLDQIPMRGVLSISVPGVVDGWSELVERHGTIGLQRALAPAIEHARRGYPVAEVVAGEWSGAADLLARDHAAARTFLPHGQPPAAGDIFANPNLAASLDQIARGGREVFYRGAIAQAIIDDLRRRDGLLDAKDFADHRSDWVVPISTTYRGYEVFELPPNTQGLTALEMLNILEGFDLRPLSHNSAAYLHLLVESKRIAFADRDAVLADAASVPADTLRTLLSKEYASARRKEIQIDHAGAAYAPGVTARSTGSRGADGAARVDGQDRGDTTYLTVADRYGNVVSLIQSLFGAFGSGIVAGDTGIVLHNRGGLFTLQDKHPNQIAPHKRPFHTLIPAMVLKDGHPWLSFGVMGGDMQPQGHVQVLANLIDFGMNVQEAGEAARFRHTEAGLALEPGVPAATRTGLAWMGHTQIPYGEFGGFQGILIDRTTGVFMGGSDPRKDGVAIGY